MKYLYNINKSDGLNLDINVDENQTTFFENYSKNE